MRGRGAAIVSCSLAVQWQAGRMSNRLADWRIGRAQHPLLPLPEGGSQHDGD